MIGGHRRRATVPYRLAHHADFPGSVVIPAHVVEEFRIRVRRRGPNECWPCDPAKPGGNVEPDPGNFPRLGWRDPKTNAYQTIPAHRLAIIVDQGPIDPELPARHLCSNARCCNPAHCYAGTSEQSSQDRKLRNAILRAQGSLDGVVLPRHPRSRMVCEALINGQDVAPIIEQERRRLAPTSGSLSIGSFRDASVPLPSPRLRPARERTAPIQ